MIFNGWPLGLGNMSNRIREVDLSAQQAAPPQTYTSCIPRSFSFSSFSSSNLDTEVNYIHGSDHLVLVRRLLDFSFDISILYF